MKCEMDQCKGSPCVALAAHCGGDSTFIDIYSPKSQQFGNPHFYSSTGTLLLVKNISVVGSF